MIDLIGQLFLDNWFELIVIFELYAVPYAVAEKIENAIYNARRFYG